MSRITILILIGLVFIIASLGLYLQGKQNFNFQAGVLLIVAASSLFARHKRKNKEWGYWSIIFELILLSLFFYHLYFGFVSDLWINAPLNFIFVPVLIVIFYIKELIKNLN